MLEEGRPSGKVCGPGILRTPICPISPTGTHAHTRACTRAHTGPQGSAQPADSLPPTLLAKARLGPAPAAPARRAGSAASKGDFPRRPSPAGGAPRTRQPPGLGRLPAPSPWAMCAPSLGPKLLTMGLSGAGPPSFLPGSLQHDPGVLSGAQEPLQVRSKPSQSSRRRPRTGCSRAAVAGLAAGGQGF